MGYCTGGYDGGSVRSISVTLKTSVSRWYTYLTVSCANSTQAKCTMPDGTSSRVLRLYSLTKISYVWEKKSVYWTILNKRTCETLASNVCKICGLYTGTFWMVGIRCKFFKNLRVLVPFWSAEKVRDYLADIKPWVWFIVDLLNGHARDKLALFPPLALYFATYTKLPRKHLSLNSLKLIEPTAPSPHEFFMPLTHYHRVAGLVEGKMLWLHVNCLRSSLT